MTRKIENKTYTITDEHITQEKLIALFSDIHYVSGFDQKLIQNILNNISSKNPDFICIPGDIIDSSTVLSDINNQELLFTLFKELGQIAKTMISLGSHDYVEYLKDGKKFSFNKKWFLDLNKLENVNLLHNFKYEDKEINFIGYTQPWNYYYSKKEKNKYVDNEQILIKELNYYLTSLINNNKCNILLCHSPIKILENDVINNVELLKEIRLILSGHMHNGMMIQILDKLIKNNAGIIYPEKQLFPKLARGQKDKIIIQNDIEKIISLIISGGITKIHDCSPEILHPLNNAFPASIEYIKIKSKTI